MQLCKVNGVSLGESLKTERERERAFTSLLRSKSFVLSFRRRKYLTRGEDEKKQRNLILALNLCRNRLSTVSSVLAMTQRTFVQDKNRSKSCSQMLWWDQWTNRTYTYGDFFSAKKMSPCCKVHKNNCWPALL